MSCAISGVPGNCSWRVLAILILAAHYWLEAIIEVGWLLAEQLKSDLDECYQLLALYNSIHRSTKT